jgi:hypothetical protein
MKYKIVRYKDIRFIEVFPIALALRLLTSDNFVELLFCARFDKAASFVICSLVLACRRAFSPSSEFH